VLIEINFGVFFTMTQFFKKNKITFEVNTPDSIKTGLQQYGQLIRSGAAFSEEMSSYCNIYFEKASGEAMTLSDLNDRSLATELYGIKIGYQMEKLKETTHLDDFILSETQFFILACQHPELKEETIDAAMAIVEYARKCNDSSDMWASDMEVFGLEVLYVIARCYPEYAYLLGAYIIPYWDTEHADYAMNYLPILVRKNGVTRDMLKAFCYCDNSEARSMMFSDAALYMEGEILTTDTPPCTVVEYFRNNPKEYAYFKQALKERFAEQDYLQYSDDSRDYTDRPVEAFYRSMLVDERCFDEDDDDLEPLEQHFVLDNADNEAADLHNDIEAFLGRPIVPPYEDEDDDDEYYFRWQAKENWQAFIEGALENGKAIWAYIEHGTDTDILKNIRPANLKKLAEEGQYKLHKTIDWHVGGFDSVHSECHAIIRDLVYDYCDEDYSRDEIEAGNQVILRTLDVLHRLFGNKPFHIDTVEFITDTWEILDQEAFDARYGGDWQKAFEQNLAEFTGYHDTVFGKNLLKCSAIVNAHRDETSEQMIQLFQQSDSGLLVLAAHLLYEDYRANRADEITTHLSTYVETHVLDMLYGEIEEESEFPSDEDARDFEKLNRVPHHRPDADEVERQKAAWEDWKRIKSFINGMEAMRPPQELLIKAMKVGKEGLTPDELALLQPPKDQLPKEEEVLELMKKHLHKDRKKISDQQRYYELFSSMSDHIQKLQVVAYLLAQMPLACSKAAARALRLMAQLAPVKTIRNISFYYRESYRDEFMDSVMGEIDFEEALIKLKVPKAGIWAWKLEKDQGNDEKEESYHSLMEMFIEGETEEDATFFGKIHAGNKAALREGIELLPQHVRFQFYKDIYKTFPEFGFSMGDTEFFASMRTLLHRNLLCPEKVFLNQVRGKGLIYAGYDHEKYAPLITGLELSGTREAALAIAQTNQEYSADYWLIVQQTKDGCKALTNDWLGHMLCLETEEGCGFYQNRTWVIVVSESCDPTTIAALHHNLADPTFKENMVETSMAYIKGDADFQSVLPIVTNAIDYFDDIEGESYYDCGVTGCIWSIGEAMRLRAFKFMTAACVKGFDAGMSSYEGDISDYIAYVKQVSPPVAYLFGYILKEEDTDAMCTLAKEHDLSGLIKGLRTEERLCALTMLLQDPSAHALIRTFDKDPSRKVRDLAGKLKPSGEQETHPDSDFTLVDFGTYAMGGPMEEATSEGASVVANGPRLLKETGVIKAAPGTTFGLRFTSNNDTLPDVCDHVVRVIHPELPSPQGMITRSSWKQNGYTHGRIFAGWAFETTEEYVPGEWAIEIWNSDESECLVSKTFQVMNEPTP